MGDVMETLEERGETHGDFRDVSRVSQYIKGAMWGMVDCGDLPAYQRESLDMISTKMARIVCGDPNNADHWLDIEGYARLARNILEEQK